MRIENLLNLGALGRWLLLLVTFGCLSWPGRSGEFQSVDIVMKVPPGATTVLEPGRSYEVAGYGRQFAYHEAHDSGRFVYRRVQGDFDITVRVSSITHERGLEANAGLMALAANPERKPDGRAVARFDHLAGFPADHPAAKAAFPLKASENRRYLVDSGGKPFLVVGDTAWSLIAQLNEADIAKYLDDRQRRGFNSIIVNSSRPGVATARRKSPPRTRPTTGSRCFTFPPTAKARANSR